MAERVDAVVIGGGLGGLAAGVTLGGNGRKVVVLEQHTVPGGYAQCFQRGPYRFDVSLHALNGLAPGGGVDRLYRELGIWGRPAARYTHPQPLPRRGLDQHRRTEPSDQLRRDCGPAGHATRPSRRTPLNPSRTAATRRLLSALAHDSQQNQAAQQQPETPPPSGREEHVEARHGQD